MKKSLGPKTYLFPMPVLLISSYDEMDNPDCMNAAWGGIHDTNEISICLDSSHKTVSNILLKKCFTVSFPDKSDVAIADYLGIVSANDVPDKLDKCGLKTVKSETIDAPIIEDFKVTLECSVKSITQDDNNTTFVIAKIINVLVDEKILDENGNIDFEKFKPISYNCVTNTYNEIGSVVGYAFKDGLKIK